MEKREFNKYYLIFFLLVLAYISYLIARPYLTAILTAAVLAYLFHPLYRKTKSLIKNETASALIITLLIISIILIPLIIIGNSIIKESVTIINNYLNGNSLQFISNYIPQDNQISSSLTDIIKSGLVYIKQQVSETLLNIPKMFLSIFITIFTLFYLLVSGESLIKKLKESIPLNKKDELLKHIGDSIYSIVYGTFATALIMFVISVIGFKIIGMDSIFLLSFIIAIAACIPFVGPSIVWIPAAIIKYLNKENVAAVSLVILGAILSSIETFVRPKIIGDRSKIHPVIVLIGITGGVPILGFIGLIIGPIVLSVSITLFKEYISI